MYAPAAPASRTRTLSDGCSTCPASAWAALALRCMRATCNCLKVPLTPAYGAGSECRGTWVAACWGVSWPSTPHRRLSGLLGVGSSKARFVPRVLAMVGESVQCSRPEEAAPLQTVKTI